MFLWTAVALAGKPIDASGTALAVDEKGFGAAVTGAGDVDGDGFGDVVVGAYGSGTTQGSAFLFLGSRKGIGTEPAAPLVGAETDAGFGFSASAAGDVNGDGFADVVVGSNPTRTGEVALFLGSADGLVATPISLTGPVAFGYAVAAAGDIDNDGFDDILVGNWAAEDGRGNVTVFRGTPDGVSDAPQVIDALGNESFFGRSVAGIGDYNGDGFDDIVVGAFGLDTAYVFFGSEVGVNTDVWVELLGDAGSEFGQTVAGAGDMNGDGRPDVAVGAPGGPNDPGKVSIFLGSNAEEPPLTPWVSWSGEDGGDGFGKTLAGLGDTNKDGFSDVAVGAPNAGEGAGRLYVFTGTDEEAPDRADQEIAGSEGDQLGASLAWGGDIDGDERMDLVAGAPGAADGAGNAVVYLAGGCGCASSGTPSYLALLPLLLVFRRR